MPYDREDRKKLYESVKADLVAAQRSNAEQFDRAVLTLSTGFLALSMSFIKDVVPPSAISYPWMLYASWVAFALVITLALVGMLYGQALLKRLISSAYDYYIEENAEALQVSERLPPRIDWINRAVGALFGVAVLLTVAFVIANMPNRQVEEKPTATPERVERSQPANGFPRIVPPQAEKPTPAQSAPAPTLQPAEKK